MLVCLLAAFALQSCFKKDAMLTAHPRGDTIAMTENYLYQLYFNLNAGKVISSNVKTGSDLGFECSGQGWHIILNTSDFMKVADLGEVAFGKAHDTVGVNWKFDKSDGNPDSVAIGRWFLVSGADTVSSNHVFAVNRGMDDLGNTLGIYQVIFDSLKNNTFYFRYCPLKGGTRLAGAVTKDPLVNYMWFSLKTGTVEHFEPPVTAYDLLFTQYTTMLYDGTIPYPYLVTGVLTNRSGMEVALDSLTAFPAITRDIATKLTYTKELDAIGYNWKYYSFKTGAYTLRTKNCYLIRTVTGLIYKLHFIGFYNLKGEKGYPVIEYEQL